MLITAKMLRSAGGREEEIKIFEAEWPNGCRVTRKNWNRAIELNLSVQWASVLLDEPAEVEYLALSSKTPDGYRGVEPAAWAAYENLEKEAVFTALREMDRRIGRAIEGGEMKIKLVFDTWLGGIGLADIYSTEVGIRLSSSDFHSGTTFQGSIEVDEDSAAELQRALADGYHPVFYVKEVES